MVPKRPEPRAKNNLVSDEINLYHTVVISKNSGKTSDLLTDDISTGSYLPKARTSGLISNNPIIWAQAFEHYLDPSVFTCQWANYFDNSNKVFEIQIRVYDKNDTKPLTIHIYLTTGVILIKGKLHATWSNQHFQHIQLIYINLISTKLATMHSVSTPITSPIITSGNMLNISSISSSNNDSLPLTPSFVNTAILDTPKDGTVVGLMNTNVNNSPAVLNSSDETPSAYINTISDLESLSLFSSSQTFCASVNDKPIPAATQQSFVSSIFFQIDNCKKNVTTSLDSFSVPVRSTVTSPKLTSTAFTPTVCQSRTTNISSRQSIQTYTSNYSPFSVSSDGWYFSPVSVPPPVSVPISASSQQQLFSKAGIHDSNNIVQNVDLCWSDSPSSRFNNIPSSAHLKTLYSAASFSTPKPSSISNNFFSSSIPQTTVFPNNISLHAGTPITNTPSNNFLKPTSKLNNHNISMQTTHIENQLNALWQATRKNWTGLECIQNGVSNITNQLGSIRTCLDEKIEELKKSITDLESRTDQKITASNNLVHESLQKDIQAAHNILRENFQKQIKGFMANTKDLHDSFNTKINEISACTPNMDAIRKELQRIEGKISPIDISSLNSMSDDITHLNSCTSNLKTAIAKIHADIEHLKTRENNNLSYSQVVNKKQQIQSNHHKNHTNNPAQK